MHTDLLYSTVFLLVVVMCINMHPPSVFREQSPAELDLFLRATLC